MANEYIYIVLSKTGTWLSRSIGIITRSDYTHAALSLDNNFNNMFTFGRKKTNNPFYGGLAIESFYNEIYQHPYCRCLIYKIPVTKEQLEKLKKEIDKYYASSIEYRYNFLGLLAVLVDKPIKREHHYFCSQFIATLLKNSTIWRSPKLPELTRPSDLVEISNKEIYYKGSPINLQYNNFIKSSIYT